MSAPIPILEPPAASRGAHSLQRVVRPRVCEGCKWQLLDKHRCERGAAPSYAQTLGRCAKHNVEWPNDPSSATRPTGRMDCNRDAMPGSLQRETV